MIEGPDLETNGPQVVGVSELLSESVCLTVYHTLGKLPPTCSCGVSAGTSENASSLSSARVDHGVPRHDKALHQLSERVLRKVDHITKHDHMLYAAAKRRFLKDVEKAEATVGVKILCHNNRAWLSLR